MTKKNTEVLAALIDLLTPLPSEDRRRIVQAAFVLLGENAQPLNAKTDQDPFSTDGDFQLPPKAKLWAKQNDVTPEMLERVFHLSTDGAEVIGEVPGKSQREQTINAYILAGLAQFLTSGDTRFADKSGRALCASSGCFSSTNHATYLKDKGSDFTGNRESGWSLTSPGLKRAAVLIKAISGNGD